MTKRIESYRHELLHIDTPTSSRIDAGRAMALGARSPRGCFRSQRAASAQNRLIGR